MIRDNNHIVISEIAKQLSGIHRRLVAIATAIALLVAPHAVLADNECGLTDGLPGTADTVTCNPADYDSGYPDGITYSSDGDFTLEIPDGADTLNVFDDGISVTGNLGDNIFLDASVFTDRIEGTGGAVIDYSSGTGDIDIDAPGGDSFASVRVNGTGNTTYGIRALSSGGGNIDVFSPKSIFAGNNVTEFTGIQAGTTGGDIGITVLGRIGGGQNADTIRRGIIAETSGSGAITIDVMGAIDAGNREDFAGGETEPRDDGQTGIYAESGTGDIAITVNQVQAEFSHNNIGIHANTAGAIDIDVGGIFSQSNRDNQIGIVTENAQLATIDVTGFGMDEDTDIAIRSLSGVDTVVNVIGAPGEDLADRTGIRGALDFAGLTGHAEVNIQEDSIWEYADSGRSTSVFSGGNDVVNVEAGGVTHMELSGQSLGTPPTELAIVDFGGGEDTFNNTGTLLLSASTGFRTTEYESELRFDNLETFNNSGTIQMGATVSSGGDIISDTDRNYDDILSMPGVDWVGNAGSRILVDTLLNAVGDPGDGCDNASRDAEGNLNIGTDCLNLIGGTASGRTEIVFNTLIPGDRGALNPDGMLVVDLSGGSADPDAFFISPDSGFYNPQFGGVIDKGLFFYPLAYDAETQQFRLYGQPSAASQQIAMMGNVVNGLWHTASGGWFDRQVDQRHVEKELGIGGAVWARVIASSAERDVTTPIIAGIETFEFDNSYTQDDSALTLGVDLISRSEGNTAWAIGPMIGYTRSRVDFDAYPNDANLEGPHFGFYGSMTFGDFYLDAVLNGVWLDMDYDAPALELFPEGTMVGTDITSLGGRFEAGWGGLNFGRLGIEPLATLSYVKTSVEDINVPADDPARFGAEFKFDDPESLRAGLGLRLSLMDVLPGIVPTDLGLTTRVVSESEGESTATIISTGPISIDQTDTFDGTFTEVVGSINVTNTAKTVSGYLNVDAAFGDDYDSLGAELGFRYQW